MIFHTLQTWRSLDPAGIRFYFWRDRTGHEVDFVLEQEGQLVALEIKSSATVTMSDTSGLAAFRESLGKRAVLRHSVVLHGGAARSLGETSVALLWGWMVPKSSD